MKYLKYFENSAAVGSGVEVDLPNVSYLEAKNVLFVPGNSGTATVKYNSTSDKIEVETGPTYEYVDLGLPSGTLWAKTNVGAQTETDYGLYFAWGETTGYPYGSTTKNFSWADYQLGNGGSTVADMTKYNATDGLTILELSDDPARANMGGNWRVPTRSQCNELTENTNYDWVTINGVAGAKFVNKTDNSKYIFIPFAGKIYNGQLSRTGFDAFVWGRETAETMVNEACANNLNPGDMGMLPNNAARCYGLSVRGVIDGNN